MIIEFSVSNYASFNHMQTLSFRATSLDSANDDVDLKNVVNVDGTRCLKLCGLYGANASGKSNLLKSFAFYTEMISNSVIAEGYARVMVNPFRLSSNSEHKSSYFQVIFLLDEKKYRHGFTLNNDGNIDSEWLFGPAEKNETYYYKRTNKDIQVNPEWFKEGLDLPEDNLRTDALFISFCSSYNGTISKTIRNFFGQHITFDGRIRRGSRRIGGIVLGGQYALTNRLIEEGNQQMVLNWFKEVGLGYTAIRIPKLEEGSRSIYLRKSVFDEQGNVIGETEMDLDVDESEGTRKFYTYIGKLYRKFKEGGMFIVDEIDSNFHPTLLQKLIQLFQTHSINTANAQLLFTSHDTNLMDPEIMRRDQFYFAEKTSLEATKLYSLADLKGIRNNADFARQYLAGIYGALPVLGDYLEQGNDGEGEDL